MRQLFIVFLLLGCILQAKEPFYIVDIKDISGEPTVGVTISAQGGGCWSVDVECGANPRCMLKKILVPSIQLCNIDMGVWKMTGVPDDERVIYLKQGKNAIEYNGQIFSVILPRDRE